jgi:soluble lytic murein transglycosylase
MVVKRSVLSGLGLGIGLMSLFIIWIRAQMEQPFLEVDESRSLGMSFELAPPVALKPLSIHQAASALKYDSPEKALKEAEVFASKISLGVLTNEWSRNCEKNYNPVMCASLREYFGDEGRGTASLGGSKLKRLTSKRPIQNRFIPDLQKEDLGLLMARMPQLKFEQIVALSRDALKTPSCPRSLSVALARAIEDHLEKAEAWELMQALDDSGLVCLADSDPASEYVFLRVALLRFSKKKLEDAVALLKRAYSATERRETHRVLYWLSRVQKMRGQDEEAKRYRVALFKEHPMSWQAIKSYVDQGYDPLDAFRSVPSYPDKYYSGNVAIDRRIHWLRLLGKLSNVDYAFTRYGTYTVARLDKNTDAGVFQHLARFFDHEGQHRLQILAMSRLLNLRPDQLSIESLRLLFPKPYMEEIGIHSPNTDTAILLGLARQESGFDPRARSGANAMGLLQVLPGTAREIRKNTNLMEAKDNVAVGALYFEKLVKMFNGSVERALAAYNAGQGRVRTWDRRYEFIEDEQLYMDLIPYRETREYVSSILRNAYWYHRLFPEITDSLRKTSGGGPQTSDMLRQQLGI